MRTLTVTTVHREWGTWRRAHGLVPGIRLNGRWLERAGFKPGDRVEITVSQGSLSIAVVRL